MRRSLVLSALGLVLPITGSARAAVVIASAPIDVADGQGYDCSVVNAGTSDLTSVKVLVSINGATPGSGTTHACEPLAPGAVCSAENDAGSPNYRYCSLTVLGNRKSVRGTFCNTSTNRCVPVQ